MSEAVRLREVTPVQTESGQWTVPIGFKHPSCPGCTYVFYEVRPERSKGGASVKAEFLCRHCNLKLANEGGVA